MKKQSTTPKPEVKPKPIEDPKKPAIVSNDKVAVIATESGHLETGKRFTMPRKSAEYLASIGHVEICSE